MLQPIVPDSTKLDVAGLPESEQKLFEKCFVIKDNFERISDYMPTSTERRVMETVVNRLTSRVIDLFTIHMKRLFGCDKDDHKSLLFKLRFWYFMFELGRHMTQIEVEDELMKKYPDDFEAFSKEFEEWHKKQENQTPLWTRESFSKWFNDYAVRGYEEYVKAKEAEPCARAETLVRDTTPQ